MREERAWRVGRVDFKELIGHQNTIKHMCPYELDHNNSFLCTSDSSVIKVWSMESNQVVSTITPQSPIIGLQNLATTASTPPILVVGCKDGSLLFYSYNPSQRDWEITQENAIPDTTLTGFLIQSNTSVVWASSRVHVFDNLTGQRSVSFEDLPAEDVIQGVLASKNECLLYSVSKGGKVVVRDTRTDPATPPQLVFQPHSPAGVTCCKWIKRDSSFLTAGADGVIKFWDCAKTSCPTSTLTGHTGPITCVDTFDRYKMVSGGKDKMVRIWSVLDETGEELRVFDGFNGKVSSISFIHNEIFTGSCKGELRRWNINV